MNTTSYPEYLKSVRWRKLSADIIRARGKCENCDSIWSLVCHHRDRSNLGSETPKDIVVLCRECHEDVEDFYKPFKGHRSLQEATDIFLQKFPSVTYHLPIVGFFRTSLDRGNFWYYFNWSNCGSLNPDLFQELIKQFPDLPEISLENWRKRCLPEDIVRVHYTVHVFATAAEKYGFRHVDDDGLTGYLVPNAGTKSLVTGSFVTLNREEGKVVGKIINRRKNRPAVLSL